MDLALARSGTSRQFLSFALIGAAGFVVDASCLSLCLWLGSGFYIGRLISYLCAATFTWAANRQFTFDNVSGNVLAQWARFLLANSLGGTINYGIYAALVYLLPMPFGKYPFLAVGAGSIAGLFANFLMSRKFVFAARHKVIPTKPETLP
jgi:putative flippase GtrA